MPRSGITIVPTAAIVAPYLLPARAAPHADAAHPPPTQPAPRAFGDDVISGKAVGAELVEIGDQHDPVQYGDAEQRDPITGKLNGVRVDRLVDACWRVEKWI
mgnify:CR=1 FL=1